MKELTKKQEDYVLEQDRAAYEDALQEDYELRTLGDIYDDRT